MNFEEERDQLIEQYLSGVLKGDALINFEEKLKTDPSLKQDVTIQKEFSKHTESDAFIEKKDHVLAIGESLKEELLSKEETQEGKEVKVAAPVIKMEPETNSFSLFKKIAVAAAVLIISFFGIDFLQGNQLSTVQDVISENTEMISWTQMSGDVDKEKENIQKFYNTKKYKEAIPLLESRLKKEKVDEKDIELHLVLGKCYLFNDQPEKAKKVFNAIFDLDPRPKYECEALLYKALSHEKLGEMDEYKNSLMKVNQDFLNESYQKAVNQRLSNLKN